MQKGKYIVFFHSILSILLVLTCLVVFSGCQNDEDSSLPSIHLKYFVDDLSIGDFSKTEFFNFDKDGELIFETKDQIKYRGNSSFKYDKKSYSLKFKQKRGFGEIKAHTKWKLNAEYIDKTLMRNKLSYDLFRSFSKNNFAPKIQFVTLYENEDYRGVYALTQSVDEESLGLDLTDPKAVLFKEPPISYPPHEHDKRFKNFKNYSKTSIRYRDFSERSRKRLIAESYYNQRFPNVFDSDMKSEIHSITEFIFNSEDSVFSDLEVFSNYFEIDNIIDWHILLLLTQNGDGFMKNFYLFKTDTNSPYLYCPWDFDHSFGREGDGEPNQEEFIDLSNMKLLDRLIETDAFNYRQNLMSKFLTLKQRGILTEEHLFGMIDENAKILRDEIAKNEQRWPLESIDYFKNCNFESELKLMKDFASQRLIEMEEYLIELQSR